MSPVYRADDIALSGAEVRRLMRANRKTISGLSVAMNIPKTRVRYVREHGLINPAFIRDWKEWLL